MHYWLSLTELLKWVQRISSLLEVWEFGRPGDCHQDRDTQTGCNDQLSGVRHKHERRSSPKTTGIFCDESWLTTGHWECDEIELYSPVIWTHCLIVSISSSPSHCLQDQRELESKSWLWLPGGCPGSRKLHEFSIPDQHSIHIIQIQMLNIGFYTP